MDAYDEIMNLCRERDIKRQQLEVKKESINQQKSHLQANVQPKPKNQVPVKKPLSYEELMKLAENNSKNTLSISDLKKDDIVTSSEAVKRPEIIRKSNDSLKKVPVRAAPQQKKPVKVIKRDMHPRHEVSDLVVLNQKKRDLRSIEQIQLELKQEAKRTISKPSSETVSKNKSSVPSSRSEDPEKYYAKNYSSIISNIFGYDRNKYANACEEDDLSDMEADYETVMKEEARSTRLGKQEDLEEELKEIERKKKKAALLKGKNI